MHPASVLCVMVTIVLLHFICVKHRRGVSLSNLNAENRECSCAVFPASDSTDEPLMARTFVFEAYCDAKGKAHCKYMCIAGALVDYEKAPNLLCEYVKKPLENVKPALFSKICGGDYEYTGLTSKIEICCDTGGNPILCSA